MHAEQEEHESGKRHERDCAKAAHAVDAHDDDDKQGGEDAEERSDDEGTQSQE